MSSVESSDNGQLPNQWAKAAPARTQTNPIEQIIPRNARLTFLNSSHSYNGNSALKSVNLDLGHGEIVCVLGPSGCGKSTLLRAAAGVLRPSSGRIFVDGHEMSGPNIFIPPEQRGVGLVFQDYALFPHMTVMRNVMFGLSRLNHDLAAQEARAALARVEMLDFADVYPPELSGGEQQRVALARASAPKPAVLLMDEPFSGLDRRLRAQTRYETVMLLKRSQSSSLIVTHDPEEAALAADRIVVMRRGEVVQTGTPREIFEHPIDADTARFIAPVNEIDSIVSGGKISTPFGNIPSDLADGTPMTVMVRPSALALGHGEDGVLDHGASSERYSTCATATIVDVRPLGSEAHIEMRFDALEQPLRMRRRLQNLPAIGETVRVCVEYSQIWRFPKQPEAECNDSAPLQPSVPFTQFGAGR